VNVTYGSQPAHLRDINERVVYRAVRELRPITRAELARRTQLSKPTVSLALRSLQSAGLVAESELQTVSNGQSVRTGRSGVLYEPVAQAALAIGAELDVDVVRAALTDLDGNELDHCVVAHGAASTDDVFDALAAAVSTLVSARRRRRLRSIVVGSPGIIDRATGVLSQSGPLGVLDGSRPSSMLEEMLRVPVTVINDVDLAAHGEQARGHGRSRTDFAVVSIGAGLGAALVLNGRVYQGARGGAGEIDDIPFRRLMRSPVPVSPALDGLVGLATTMAPRFRSTSLRAPYTADSVFAAFETGDRLAIAVVERLAEWTSWFSAAIVAVVDPELIVLAGPIGAREPVADRVRSHLAQMLPVAPEVAVSELGAGSVIAGAIAVASDHALQAALDERGGRSP